jgi:hypothetical protein
MQLLSKPLRENCFLKERFFFLDLKDHSWFLFVRDWSRKLESYDWVIKRFKSLLGYGVTFFFIKIWIFFCFKIIFLVFFNSFNILILILKKTFKYFFKLKKNIFKNKLYFPKICLFWISRGKKETRKVNYFFLLSNWIDKVNFLLSSISLENWNHVIELGSG